jgi:hypothetical protein
MGRIAMGRNAMGRMAMGRLVMGRNAMGRMVMARLVMGRVVMGHIVYGHIELMGSLHATADMDSTAASMRLIFVVRNEPCRLLDASGNPLCICAAD